MHTSIQGTFHFHSTYSHDGKNTLGEIAASLKAKGFSFCLMTEHFEDLSVTTFNRYIQEANGVTEATGFILVPGIEVDLSGLHTIIFNVHDYDEISQMAWAPDRCSRLPFKILAHPSKYPFERVQAHMEKYNINGLELWNQQADSVYLPPLKFLNLLKTHVGRNEIIGFFGCDLHDTHLSVANILSLQSQSPPTAEAILTALLRGDFVAMNLPTGIEFRNGPGGTDLASWIEEVTSKPYYQAKLRMGTRQILRWLYKSLPRGAQRFLNNTKNYLRNKI
jgi:hypothetical protein